MTRQSLEKFSKTPSEIERNEPKIQVMRAEYGLDAPRVVRNLFLFSPILAVLAASSFYLSHPVWFWVVFLYSFSTALILFINGLWMLYGIKIAKPRILQKMIQKLNLKGEEKILDLGCGRGLLLSQAAKHLSSGKAHGIDVWSSKDQSRNTIEQAMENVKREGLQDKVTIETGDVRNLPYPDHFFDTVISSLCIHNLKDRKEREKALLEMRRVLKPGGQFAIADIQRAKEYQAFFKKQGLQVDFSETFYSYLPPITTIVGKFVYTDRNS